MGVRRRPVVVAVLALAGALVVPAGADTPSPGKWVAADASWLFPTGPGTARLIEVNVTQHTAVTGEVTTAASAWKGWCKRDDRSMTCVGNGGPRFTEVTLTYDETVSTARLKLVTRTGRVFRVSWQASEPIPRSARQDESSCWNSDGETGSSSDYSVSREASASAHVFGRTLGAHHFYWGDLGVGAGTRPCSMSNRAVRYS